MEKLKSSIEAARKKLEDAVGDDYQEQTCYSLSVELDKLIELYISLEEGAKHVPMA